MSEVNYKEGGALEPFKVKLTGGLQALLQEMKERNEGLKAQAEQVKSEELERKAYEDLASDYNERVTSYRETVEGYAALQGSVLKSRWKSAESSFRAATAPKQTISGTEVEHRLDPRNQKDNSKVTMRLQAFAEEFGLNLKVSSTEKLIEISRNSLDRVVDGEVKRLRLIDPITLGRETDAVAVVKAFFERHQDQVGQLKGAQKLEPEHKTWLESEIVSLLLEKERKVTGTINIHGDVVLSSDDLYVKKEAVERATKCVLGKFSLEQATTVEPYLKMSDVSGTRKVIEDGITGFKLSYPEEQFEAFWTGIGDNKDKEGAKNDSRDDQPEKLTKPLSYIHIRPKPNYLDERIEDGVVTQIGKGFLGTMCEFITKRTGESNVDFSSINYKEVNITRVREEFNKFFQAELTREKINFDPKAADKFYDILQNENTFGLLRVYMGYVGIIPARDVPYGYQLDRDTERSELYHRCQAIERSRRNILSDMKKHETLEGILKTVKSSEALMMISNFHDSMKAILRNDPQAIEIYDGSAASALERTYLMGLMNRSSTSPEDREQYRQQIEEYDGHLARFPVDKDVAKLEGELCQILTTIGREQIEMNRERYRNRQKEESSERVSYLDAGSGAVSPDIQSVEFVDEFQVALEQLDKEFPSELDGISIQDQGKNADAAASTRGGRRPKSPKKGGIDA